MDKDLVTENTAGIAIVGNMNVGKSTLFSQMSGAERTCLNIPGNTVSITVGHIKGTERELFDTPGIFSIFSSNEDERASRDILLPHITDREIGGIILVADVKNMKRSVAIALQYAEYGLPMLFDVNMIDEAAPRGIEVDTRKLSEILGIDVFTTIANEGIGVSKIMSGIREMKVPPRLVTYPDRIEQFLDIVAKLLTSLPISARAAGLLLLAEDGPMEEYVKGRFGDGMLQQIKDLAAECRAETSLSQGILLANLYNKTAGQIVDRVQEVHPPPGSPFLMKFGDWCTQLSTGIPIAGIILFFMYLFVGSFAATFAVDTINGILFEGFLIPLTTKLVQPIPSAFIRDMIVDPDFGILPTGVFLALGLVAPVLFCFYIAFGILEDSGYLPRVSILVDRLFQRMGLNGKGVIPLVMGFSCVTMAILTTRLLDSEKEKNIASFLLFLAMPCAPLVAVMLVILEKMPASASIALFGLIFSQVVIAGMLANRILPGFRTPLFMEIPAMRFPKPLQIIRLSARKTYFFMKEALPVFIIASFFVFLFQRAGGLKWIEHALGPFFSNLMGLPEASIRVFIKTMIRREIGATELEHLSSSYSNLQIVVNLLVMTFIIPCLNATIVLFKERGVGVASAICAAVLLYAVVLGSIINHSCHLLGITFT